MNPVERYVAESKMKLKNSNHCLSFVTTSLKGEVIMCTFNNISKEIIDIFCTQNIDHKDFEELEFLVNDFIFGG